jgi:hypothetical protein
MKKLIALSLIVLALSAAVISCAKKQAAVPADTDTTSADTNAAADTNATSAATN